MPFKECFEPIITKLHAKDVSINKTHVESLDFLFRAENHFKAKRGDKYDGLYLREITKAMEPYGFIRKHEAALIALEYFKLAERVADEDNDVDEESKKYKWWTTPLGWEFMCGKVSIDAIVGFWSLEKFCFDEEKGGMSKIIPHSADKYWSKWESDRSFYNKHQKVFVDEVKGIPVLERGTHAKDKKDVCMSNS